MSHGPAIHLRAIGKRFGDFVALNGVDLDIRSGELLALLGPSGSGKTTMLRIIAGLEWPDEGDLLLNGDSALRRGVRERHIGFVFQHYALFRHMSVLENVAFGLRVMPRQRRPGDAEIRGRVQRLLDLVQIGHLGDRYPSQLSGGERQRVALARALAIEPSVLLLDEPFGALDAKVRKELRRWLRQLHDRLSMTTVFVTHDQEEALELADRVVVLGHGKIEQVGTPEEVYGAPRNPFVFDFLGQVNRVRCQVRGGRPIVPYAHIEQMNGDAAQDGPGTVYVRPHDVVLARDPAGSATVRFVGVVGPAVRLEVEVVMGAPVLEAEMPLHAYAGYRFVAGDRVSVRFRTATLFSDVTGDPPLSAADQSLLSAAL
ncbi:MAG TPA: sulfate ABC transporter ATP-binding protein [Vineibacter sp.]|nr:sulfate ABC transporter ATP-binding protein [Vineibacter sp.]